LGSSVVRKPLDLARFTGYDVAEAALVASFFAKFVVAGGGFRPGGARYRFESGFIFFDFPPPAPDLSAPAAPRCPLGA
jgi:hypothetical protein